MPEALRRMARLLLLFAASFAAVMPVHAAPTPAGAGSGRLECWVDDRGQRACGDALPPKEARRQREMRDKRGVVKKVVPAERTAEEVAEEKRITDEHTRELAYDRYLVQTYQNVGEIEKVRDERLIILDGRMTLAQKALVDNTAALETLKQREQTAPDPGDTLDPTLKRKIREFTTARSENLSAIMRIKEERVSVVNQFTRDIQRYRTLKEAVPVKTAAPISGR